jgi:hypothetical protein
MTSTFYAKSLLEHPGHSDQSVHGRRGGGFHVASFRVEPGKSGGGKLTVTRKHASDEYGMDATQKTYTLRGKKFSRFMGRGGALEKRGVVQKSGVEGMYRRVVKAGSGSYGGGSRGSVSSGVWSSAVRAATPMSRRYG